MKKISFLILLSLFLATLSYSQDWQCIHDDAITFFVDTTHLSGPFSSNTMVAVSIDSVKEYNDFTYHYGARRIRLVSNSSLPGGDTYCYDAFSASRMGFALAEHDGVNLFFNQAGDEIRFLTLGKPGDSWYCCRINDTSHLEASILSSVMETVLGQSDSVKYIHFQAKSNNGQLLDHPMNSQLFKLSKISGMLTLFDFYEFPQYYPAYPAHLLSGLNSNGLTQGEHNLSFKDIYSFSPGDVFHVCDSGWCGPHNPPPVTKKVITILDSTWSVNKDTVTYRMEVLTDAWLGLGTDAHIYSREIVRQSYSTGSQELSGLNDLPEHTVFYNNSSGDVTAVNLYTQSRSADYNSRWLKVKGNDYDPFSTCSDTLIGKSIPYFDYHYKTSYFIEGCGGPYHSESYTDWSHDQYSLYYKLVYFKKGTETWGTPYDTTKWTGIEENGKFRDQLYLYPNPAKDQVTLKFHQFKPGKYHYVITSILGNLMENGDINDGESNISLIEYRKGIYIIQLFEDNILLGKYKLVKQ